MYSRVSRVANLTGIACIVALIGFIATGCGGVSPWSSMYFAQNLTGLGSGAPDPDPVDPADPSQAIDSVCDLPEAQRVIAITLTNEAQQAVQYSMTLVASAGPGGWVCDDERQAYINAGYSEALVPGSGNIVTIGCDTLTLLSGNQLLALEFGINQGELATIPASDGETSGNAPSVQLVTRGTTVSPLIPLPEVIVFGNDDPDFSCVGGSTVGDLCTQRGFVYVSEAGLPVGKAVEVSRIQGTICNQGFGTAPEYRLDKNLNDGQVQGYQYMPGGQIVITILDRSDDDVTETRNQAVWLVTNADGNTIHSPVR